MAFKMKGPSLLKMVAELKKSPTKKSFKPETMKKTSGGKSGSLSDVVTNIKGKAIKALDKIEKKAIYLYWSTNIFSKWLKYFFTN